MSTSMIRLAPAVRHTISRIMTPDPPPTSSTTSLGAGVHQVQEASHNRQVIRVAALFEDTDDAEKRPTEADRAISRAQRRDQRIPLRWRQRKRYQKERRPCAAESGCELGHG